MPLHRIKLTALLSVLLVTTFIGVAAAENSVPKLYEASFESETNGNYAAALNRVLEIVRGDTKNYTATLRTGWLFYMNKKYSAAIDFYEKAAALKPEAIEPLLGITLPLMAANKWKGAENAARKIIQKDPCNYIANSRLAYILFSQGQYGEAKAIYEKLLQLYPADIEMKLGLAWTYVKMGDKIKAYRYFKEVLMVRSTNVTALAGMDAVRKM